MLFYVLAGASTAAFFWGVCVQLAKYRRGRGSASRVGLNGILRMLVLVGSHRWIRRRGGAAGWTHLAAFYGFSVLFLGTVILAFDDDVAKPIFGFDFWRGSFYLGYSLFLDVFGSALLISIFAFTLIRLRKPARLDYRRADGRAGRVSARRYVSGDWLFLASLVAVTATGFLVEAFRVANTHPSFERWSPIGWGLGTAMRDLGLVGGAAHGAWLATWWLHSSAALLFVAAIPFTKAAHILSAPSNIASRDETAGKKLPELAPGALPGEVGYAALRDLPPRLLLSLDACTKCGRCHVVCPANIAGYPLSPRDLILDLREFAEGAAGIRSRLGIPPAGDLSTAIVGAAVTADTIWACTQCMACVDVCPVGIEHVPIINGLRRQLVERGELEDGAQEAFETIYELGNSLGRPRSQRGRWTQSLPFSVKDIKEEPAEVLWFVGDYASFDERNLKATLAFAHLLHEAGVDFGILFDAEVNAGCDVRRAGEEGLFQLLRDRNRTALEKCEFNRIVTTDAHSFHALKNEYRTAETDVALDVLHHTQMLAELVNDNRLKPRSLGSRCTYHDPCMIGRYNGIYDQPRSLLVALGMELVEMPRNRDSALCCGAGGGRIWMAEKPGTERPSTLRIREAAALEVPFFVVACPKDVTMYSDALKTSGFERDMIVAEISELVAKACL